MQNQNGNILQNIDYCENSGYLKIEKYFSGNSRKTMLGHCNRDVYITDVSPAIQKELSNVIIPCMRGPCMKLWNPAVESGQPKETL